MTDKPESQPSEHRNSSGQARKQGAKPSQPSFEDVLSGKAFEPPAPEPRPQQPKPAPQPAAQPTFEDILAKAAPASSPPPEGVQAQAPGGREKSARPPKRDRDQRRMPIVVRKPALGQPLPAETSAAEPHEAAADQHQEHSAAEPRAPRAPRPPPAPLAESVFATPTAEEDGDFGALLAEAGNDRQRTGKLRAGQRISAKVAHLGAEVAFLDLGGKGEGIIDLSELRNEKGEVLVHQGETIDGYVLSVGGEAGVVITRSVPKGAGREHLHAAMEAKVPVEGTVTGQNKGGLEVDVGGLRAFVPASQVDVRFVEDQSQFVGQKLKFLIVELRGGNAVLSRRALLEDERKHQAAELRKTLEVGAALEGVVTSVRDFGAFVDLGGLEGLIHVSELSHARIAHAQDAVKPGQKVRVQVLRIDPPKDKDGERIALSLRALEQDPWDAHIGQLSEGMKLQGKVARLQPFGAFVELFPGVDGLVHVSALANKHVNHPREVVQEGEQIWVQVESIDPAQHRVSLRRITEEEAKSEGPVQREERGQRHGGRDDKGGERGDKSDNKGDRPAPAKRARVGDVVDATVDRCEPFGVFVKWEGPTAGRGLVPNPELGTPRGSDNKKVMPVGTQFKATIIELDTQGRYRLSKVATEAAIERAEMEEYHRSVKKPAGKGFGTLGDLLRAKLQPKE